MELYSFKKVTSAGLNASKSSEKSGILTRRSRWRSSSFSLDENLVFIARTKKEWCGDPIQIHIIPVNTRNLNIIKIVCILTLNGK